MTLDLGFIDPTFGNERRRIALAPRPADLADKVIGMIDNTKEQADVILQTMADALRERYGVARVIIRPKEHYTKPAAGELINEMAKEVQLVVSALGG